MAVNASGLTIAAWDQFRYANGGGASVGVAIQSGGRWGAPFSLGAAAGFSMSPKVAVGAEGTLVVSWIYEDPITKVTPERKVQVAVKPPGSAWTVTTLATAPLGGPTRPNCVPVKVDSQGNVTACWTLWDGAWCTAQAAHKLAGQSWGTPVELALDPDVWEVSLAVNANGDAGVAFNSCSRDGANSALHYVFRQGPAGTWTMPTTLSEVVPSIVGYIKTPLVALEGKGLATVVFLANGVQMVRQMEDGSWMLPRTLLQAQDKGASYLSPSLAMDENGNAMVAASIFDPTLNVTRASVWANVRLADGNWTGPQRLTDPSFVDAYATRVAVSMDGALALAGWINHLDGTVQISKMSLGNWQPPQIIGRGTAYASFQEVLSLDATYGMARAIWKNAKGGVRIMAASYGR